MMQIAVISMVRNEADIIESFVRHAASLADKIYIVEHASTDETAVILKKLAAEGLSLEVRQYAGAAQTQAEIMTDLMQTAFAAGADFVLPLDADEFLLPDGEQDMGWCREALLSVCTPAAVYQLPWVTYQTREEYHGQQFILAQESQRESQPEELGKLLLGREAWEKTGFRLSQGNHHALLPAENGVQRLAPLPLTGVHLAHFPWRSSNQAASKAAVGWLANVAKYSRQTNLANHWRQGFYRLLAGEKTIRPLLKHGQPARIAPSCKARQIVYTKAQRGEVVLLRNVLLAAEQLANAYSEQQAASEQHKVSILLPYLGEPQAFQQSFASVVEEDYPQVNLIVFPLGEAVSHDEWLLEFLQEQSEKTAKDIVYLQEQGDILWQDLAESADGEFIQWVFPGDVLTKHKLQPMVTTLTRHGNIDFVLTNSMDYPALQPAKERGTLVDLQLPDGFAIGDGNVYRQYLQEHQALLTGGLSAPLFRRQTMQRCDFGRKFLQDGEPQWQAFWQSVLQDAIIGAMDTSLVEMHSQL
ncbi:glycosyltransferase family 2 protein [Selenomonas caprae]|uniref:Glycosyltransferase family 2 protein n=1 Tax=Selenomonas caprae TaxID=2606905 RepID=A0A5D6WPH4_9FIRM|nr:glycosyltransferase family 2 protein [Selenomonas caprae]TYZ28979.1 glycosyltransferase family 2 protein [Selenomonas caprae]